MEDLTDTAFSQWKETHPHPDNNLKNWARLIDDGFGLWPGSLQALRELVEFLSMQVPSMKFSMETTCPREGCPEAREDDHECQHFLTFLDLRLVVDGEGKIQSELYMKLDGVGPVDNRPSTN